MRLLIFGPPGSGKSTVTDFLSTRFGVPKISTGEILRDEERHDTALGRLAHDSIHTGSLVPDDAMIAMIERRIGLPDCCAGYVLDGFPRTLAQAEALEPIVAPSGGFDQALYLNVPVDELVKRLSNRLICPAGHTYNLITHPPRQPGVCDIDGLPLERRDDDDPETVRHRIEVYLENTLPALDFYRDHGLVAEIDGTLTIHDVQKQAVAAVIEGVRQHHPSEIA